jgi:predicted flap endonuclease-1-like 5' DNA nuclease
LVELWNHYWPVILVGLLVGLITGYLIFRPRQRVTLSSDTPVRPHMAAASEPPQPSRAEPARFRGIADEAARAAGDVAGPILGADVSGQLPAADGAGDDLQQMKGVGPKLAAMLNARGLTRFDQIAGLSPGQVEALDAELGAFCGRLSRDRIVEQAHYLARGDLDGYKQNFGAL